MSNDNPLTQPWYLLGDLTPDITGMTIMAGDQETPCEQLCVCDTQDLMDASYDETARAIATHIVDLHNKWLENQ